MREAFWNCPHCGTAHVPGRESVCPTCGRARPAGTPLYVSPDAPGDIRAESPAAAPKRTSMGADMPLEWTCAFCGARNAADARDCPRCGAPRDRALDRGVPADAPVVTPPPSRPAPEPSGGGCFKIGCGSLVGAVALFVALVSWAAHKGAQAPVGGEDLLPARVMEKTASRSIVVEKRRHGHWEPVRTETARSDGGPLEWPRVKLAKGERLGHRSEEYGLRLHMTQGSDEIVTTYRMFWEPLKVGQHIAVRRGRDGVDPNPYPVDSLAACRRWYRRLPGATPQTDLGCTPPPAKP